VLGKHSGRNAVRRGLERINGPIDDDVFAIAFTRFKELADDSKEIREPELERLLDSVTQSAKPRRTLFEKIWDAHVVRAETVETPAILYVDLQLIHEVTSPQAFSELDERGVRVRRPERSVATM